MCTSTEDEFPKEEELGDASTPPSLPTSVRPRLLYFSIFIWISLTGGRFLAPVLETEGGLSDSQIGMTLALQTAISSFCSSWAGAFADAQERKHPHRGRAQVLMGGVGMGTLLFLLQGTHHLFPKSEIVTSVSWHVMLRCLYAAMTSTVSPVLDGLTLDYLSNSGVASEKADFGKERLYGAISWAIAHLIMGISLDKFGFPILYIYAIVSTIAVLTTVVVYMASQEARYRQQEPGQIKALTEDGDNHDPVSVSEEEQPGEDEEVAPLGLNRQKSHLVEEKKTLPLRDLLGLVFSNSFGVAFMVTVFCLSIGTAVVEGLIFLYFEVLGSSYSLCAYTVQLTVIFEIPIFHVAPDLLKKYGSTKMLQLACLCYMIRVVGYSLVPDGQAWWVLLFEPLHGITYACATSSAVEFIALLMPVGYEASGQGLLYTFRGSGSVVGLLLGGTLTDMLGPRAMYRILSAIVTVGFMLLGMASWRCPPPDNGNQERTTSRLEYSRTASTEDDVGEVELMEQLENIEDI